MNHKNRLNIISALIVFLLFSSGKIIGEGTKEMSPTAADSVMLHTNASGFGNFASFVSFDSISSLNLRIKDFTTDSVYIGLSAEHNDFGVIDGLGTYTFRILDPTGAVAFGPFTIGSANDNATSWALASNGPDVNGAGGYSTNTGLFPYSRFSPTMNGDYVIQFDDGSPFNIVNILWYDFTVRAAGVVQPGRLWSRNWALRTPPRNANTPPECQFDRPFNGVFYSYTMDGFVSRIDFDSSGFQGLSFTVSFGDRGPGNSGNVIADRRSVNDMNATANNADHQIFLNDPDNMEFPSSTAQCGSVALISIGCDTPDSFCITIGVTQPGQVEIILDFVNNGIFDPDTTDVLLAMFFTIPDTVCIPWNGLKGDGSQLAFGEQVPAVIRYSQGVQHYAAFDVEFLKFGFCVQTIRPICPGIATDLLYWDDSQITDDASTFTIDEGDPGTGQPKIQFNGCTCGVDSCRTWTTFQIGDPPTGSCTGTPFGYGENSTLNTWWFASTTILDNIFLPFAQVSISGDSAICAGDSTSFFANVFPDTVSFDFLWSGPDGFSATTQSSGFVNVAGFYFVTITDPITNCTSVDSVELVVNEAPSTLIDFVCLDSNQQNANVLLTVSGGLGPYTFVWSNGAITEDIFNVPPGQYSVIVTDANGCMAFDTIVVQGCCELIVMCPPVNGGIFACVDDVPDTTMNGIVLIQYCDDFTISVEETNNEGTGCPGDTLIITRVFTVEDATGNTQTCIQTFTVVDTISPNLVTPANDTSIICTDSIDPGLLGFAVFEDNCSSATVTFRDDSIGFDGTCTNNVIGTVLRKFFAEDDCGNIDSAFVQEISIIDTLDPVITLCPADVTVSCTDSTDPLSLGSATATDNCSSAVDIIFLDSSLPPGCTNITPLIRTWTATDDCGNSSTCLQSILIQDLVPPSFITPDDITIACDEDTSTQITGFPTGVFDNCSEPDVTFSDSILIGDCSPFADTVIRTWVVTDICGNSSIGVQTIFRVDTVPPTFTVPPSTTISCDQDSLPATTGTVTDTLDNCSFITVTFSDLILPNECPSQDSIVRTWIVTDFCGNSSTAIQLILRLDLVAPTFTVPADTIIDCGDSTLPPGTGDVTDATDNCSGVTITFADVTVTGLCPILTVINRTWIVSDQCDNTSTGIQVIMVQDTTAPTFITPVDITIDCEVDINDLNQTGNVAEVTDCSSIQDTTYSDVVGIDGCDGTAVIFRTWVISDFCNNSSSGVQDITIQDTLPPDITVPDDVTIECDQDPQDTSITGGMIIIFDNCSLIFGASFTDDTSGLTGCNGTGVLLRTWLIDDECENASTMTQEITIVDQTPPTAICQNITIDFGVNIIGNISPEDIDDGSFDNCGDVTLSLSDTTFACEEFEGAMSVPVILTVTDECGNSSTCEALISGIGGLLEIDCPDDFIIYLGPGGCSAFVNYVVTADAICGGTNVMIIQTDSSGLTSGDAFPIGVTVQTYIATNGADTVSCSFTITVIESDVPVVMACNDTINVSVAANCEAHIFVDMILEGDQYGCFDDFIISIDSVGIDTGWIVVSGVPINHFYMVTITDPETGNSCWGRINLEDKFPPQIICACPPDAEGVDSCTISCLEVDLLASGNIPLNLYPEVIENCGEYTLEISDLIVDDQGCGEGTIVVTWVVTDSSGLSASCVQEFDIEPLSIDSLIFPPSYTGPCGSSSDPDVTGWPQIHGIDLTDEVSLCNLFLGYWDKTLQDCGGGQKILRTWTILDWCTLELVEANQIIKLSDDQGPVLTCPKNITVGTDFWYCYANVSVPKPQAHDACSDIVAFSLSVSSGTVIAFGNNFVVNGLELGTYIAVWTVTDLCGNSSTCSFTITVVDNVVPIANCDQHTIVSLTNDGPRGITLVPASVLDDGSYDNCGPVTFRARRMDSCIDFDWTTNGACIDDVPNGTVNSSDLGTSHKPCVPFACCDVGAGSIMVELEVTDASGNVNYCMVEVTVQDKISPFLDCPPDITISCDFWFNVQEGTFIDKDGNNNGNLDEDPLSPIFGNMFNAFQYNDDESIRQAIIINDPGNEDVSQPHNWGIDGWADDNCSTDLEVRVSVFNDCSGDNLPPGAPANAVKLIERRFIAKDNQQGFNPSVCTQRIWVVDFDPFYITDINCQNNNPNDGVKWPCDVLLTTCPDSLNGTGEPTIFDDACSLIGVAYEDTRFDFVDGACFKILREWSVIDWCQYNTQTGEGLWHYTQVIKVHDAEGPEFLNCPVGPVVLCVADDGVSLPDNNQAFLGEENPQSSSCSAHLNLCQTVHEACSDFVHYDVKMYLFNGIEFIYLKPLTTVPVDENHNAALCFDTRQNTSQSIRNNGIPYNSPFCGDYHRILWSAEDGCGNWSHCEYLIRLEDCKQPSPVCIQGLSTVVMPIGCEVTLWAKDFNASSFDDCTQAAELLYSFSGDSYQPSKVFNTSNILAFGVELAIAVWVADGGTDDNCNGVISWDERNKDYCTTTIVFTDNSNNCGGSGSIVFEGQILTDHNETVESVEVSLNSNTQPVYGMKTIENGRYILIVPQIDGQRYQIIPKRADQHRNGVSTLDLVRIQKHLLGKELFDSPYQYIAADANDNQQVSAIDLVEIRKLILGIYHEFPNNESWRFLDKGFVIPDPNHPWPFEEVIQRQYDGTSQSGLDFIGVKIGDVNNTVQANALQIHPREGRRVIHVRAGADTRAEIGKVINVSLTIPEVLEGFQWTLETLGLEYLGIASDDIAISNENVGALKDGIVTMSWNRENDQKPMDKEDMTIVIQFLASQSGEIMDMISLSGQVTEAEAYIFGDEILDVKLDKGLLQSQTDFALFQNEPNPWTGSTTISFNLPESGLVKLTLFDMTGKTIQVIEGEYPSGRQSILLNKKDISAHGILYYRLDIGSYSATKKMIRVE